MSQNEPSTMSLSQWLSKLNPVQRTVDDVPAGDKPVARGVEADELRSALDQLRARHGELSRQVDQLRAVAEVAARPPEPLADPRIAQVQQQIESLRLQHDSLLAGLHEAASSSTAQASQLSSVVGRIESIEHGLKSIGDPEALQQQLLSAAQSGRLEIDNKFAEIQGSVRKMQTTMTSVIQSAEVAREAYLARDNARIAESKRESTVVKALVGISLLLGVVALLTALKALSNAGN